MKLLIVGIILIWTSSAQAQDLPSKPNPPAPMVAHLGGPFPVESHYFILELLMVDGTTNRWGFRTAKECKASIHRYEKEQQGFNGHCLEVKWQKDPDPLKGWVKITTPAY